MIVVGGRLHEVFRICVFLYPIGDALRTHALGFRVFDPRLVLVDGKSPTLNGLYGLLYQNGKRVVILFHRMRFLFGCLLDGQLQDCLNQGRA